GVPYDGYMIGANPKVTLVGVDIEKWEQVGKADPVSGAVQFRFYFTTVGHTHAFKLLVIEDAYQLSPADCTHAAVYVRSCECGEADKDHSNTFTIGSALGHDWDDGVVTIEPTYTSFGQRMFTCQRCKLNYYEGIKPLDRPTIEGDVVRIWGDSRYSTSADAIAKLKTFSGKERFDAVVLATGQAFPDALSGCYLAEMLVAPLILVDPSNPAAAVNDVTGSIKEGGMAYILGGKNAVSEELVSMLGGKGIACTRLSDDTRYGTNIKILNEINDVETINTLLLCSGDNYADALSASSCGYPILMVASSVQDEQVSWLQDHAANIHKIYVIGGNAAVSEQVAQQVASLAGCTDMERIAGSDRYHTSTEVAEAFFPDTCPVVMLTYAWNFPDGLSGGPVAAILQAPILLTDNSDNTAMEYVRSHGVEKLAVMGGTANISDATVNKILG
ncbi:MAG: cell wall-binding repeat-containing protein, partial [Lachnospiraceae bacterium]|nr:cell wall-binding repeat-containing protein [Candidatus Equihabitans merdae]